MEREPIEPIPELYQQCKRIRRRSRSVNCALVEKVVRKKLTMIYVSSLVNHIQAGIENQHIAESYEVKLIARNLMDKLKTPHIIDFMSLDLEGSEGAALRGMDFDAV